MKIILYQVLPRLYGNRNTHCVSGGTIAQNGCGKLNDFTPSVLKRFREMGISHVWYTGVIRHATQTDYTQYGIPKQHPAVVKGQAGSPYAIADYYDVDPDLAVSVPERMQEFLKLVNRTHRAGLKVIIDFVPNHVARQYKSICKPEGVKDLGEDDRQENGFDPQNNFYYCPGQHFMPYFDLYSGEEHPYDEFPARATGNDCFHNAPNQNDWYETVKLNYGVDYYAGRQGHFDPIPDTWLKMLDILMFWAAKGVDGFRCDMAEMVPAEFWAWATERVKEQHPGLIFIGEVYNPAEYRRYLASGFDYLYDKVGMYDAMREVICHRRGTNDITWAWQQNDDIREHMLYFLENHDEQRIASDFFAANGRKAVPALIANLLMYKNPFMFYAGQEYGEHGMDKEGFSGHDGRTTIFDYWSVDTLKRAAEEKLTDEELALANLYSKVLSIARNERAIGEGLSFDLMYVNGLLFRQYAFIRKAQDEVIFVAVNFADISSKTDIVVPAHAFDYLELNEKVYQTTDLLTGKSYELPLKRDGKVSLTLESRGGVALKFKAK